MNFLANVLNTLMSLGSFLVIPIVIFIMGLIFKMPLAKAFRSGIYTAAGFVGVNTFIGFFLGAVSPATVAFVENTGLDLGVLDAGFVAATVTGWGSPIAVYILPVGLVVNMLMLMIGSTKTVDIDIWNYWIWGLSAALVYTLTNDIMLAFIAFIIVEVSTLILADITAPKVQEQFEIPGISIPHADSVPWAIIAYPVNAFLNKIPAIKNLDSDSEAINKKIGILGEPAFIGFIMGILLGIFGRIGIVNTMKLAVNIPAALIIFPIIIRLIREGLLPVADAVRNFLQKRFPGKEYYIGLDAAVIVGDSVVLATSMIIIPILILLAVILPGNRVLPMANLSSLFFHICVAVAICERNLIKSIITSIVIFTVGFYICTATAVVFTQTAVSAGFQLPEGTTLITAFVSGFAPNTWFSVTLLDILNKGSNIIAATGGILVILTMVIYSIRRNKKIEAIKENLKQDVI